MPQVDPRHPYVKTPETVKARVKATGEIVIVNSVSKEQFDELQKPKHQRDSFVMSTLPPEPYLDPKLHDPDVDQDELAQGQPDPLLVVPSTPVVGQPRAPQREEEKEKDEDKGGKDKKKGKSRPRIKDEDEDEEDDD